MAAELPCVFFILKHNRFFSSLQKQPAELSPLPPDDLALSINQINNKKSPKNEVPVIHAPTNQHANVISHYI